MRFCRKTEKLPLDIAMFIFNLAIQALQRGLVGLAGPLVTHDYLP